MQLVTQAVCYCGCRCRRVMMTAVLRRLATQESTEEEEAADDDDDPDPPEPSSVLANSRCRVTNITQSRLMNSAGTVVQCRVESNVRTVGIVHHSIVHESNLVPVL